MYHRFLHAKNAEPVALRMEAVIIPESRLVLMVNRFVKPARALEFFAPKLSTASVP